MHDAPTPDFLALQEALVGRYSIQHEIGRGGMGIVYLAHDVALDRPVALKLLPPSFAAQPALRERFIREARAAAMLSQPNIVPIHSVEAAGDFVFFVMSSVEGETLGERVRARGPVSPAEGSRILGEVAWALAYAHAHGMWSTATDSTAWGRRHGLGGLRPRRKDGGRAADGPPGPGCVFTSGSCPRATSQSASVSPPPLIARRSSSCL